MPDHPSTPNPKYDTFPSTMQGPDIMAPYRQERYRPWYAIARDLRTRKGELTAYWNEQVRKKTPRNDYAKRYWEEYWPYYLRLVGKLFEAVPLIHQNDGETIEYVLGYLEAKPYFEKSQYLYTRLKRAIRQITLTGGQFQRWQEILRRDAELAALRRTN